MMDEKEHRRRAIAHLKSAVRYERKGLRAKARAHFGRAMHYGSEFGNKLTQSELPDEIIEIIVRYAMDGSTEVSASWLAFPVKVNVPAFLAMSAEDMRNHVFYPFYIRTVHATARKSTHELLSVYGSLIKKSDSSSIAGALTNLRIMIVEHWYHMCPYRFHDLVEILHAEGTPDAIKAICKRLLDAFTSHLGSTEGCTECRILKRPEIKQEIQGIINKTITPAAIEITEKTDIYSLVRRYKTDTAVKDRYGHLCVWKTGGVRDMARVFLKVIWMDEEWDVRLWDTCNVSDMSYAFYECSGLLSGVECWSVAGVADMSYMFSKAISFNRDISRWDTRNVVDMSSMFYSATSFNQDIGNWDTSKVGSMRQMFYNADVFNRDIGKWDTSKVTNMNGMFGFARSFNQPIGKWKTGLVNDMSEMFNRAGSFNQPIGTWDTSNVTDMSGLFLEARAFNQDLGRWNTSEVSNMTNMFCSASAFNQNIRGWDMGKVDVRYDIDKMFDGATAMESNNKPPVTIQQ